MNRTSNIMQGGLCLLFVWLAAGTVFAQSLKVAGKVAGKTPVKTTLGKPAAQEQSQNPYKIWLSLDVVEQPVSQQAEPKYRADVEVTITDSATSKQLYARSGDMVQLMPRRTYFVMLTKIPAKNGVESRVQGQRTQVLHTNVPKDGDIMYERKFVLTSQGNAVTSKPGAPQTTINKRPAINAEADESGEVEGSFPESVHSRLSPVAPLYFVIQYCSLSNEAEALETKSFLVQNGVTDARVELFTNPMGQRYYRVRSGSYNSVGQAKSFAASPLWKQKKWTLLHIKPIVVRVGV